METYKLRLHTEGTFEVHELAALVPMATDLEQAALTEDIRLNSQKEPVTLWKGALIDGRCRQLALSMLRFPIAYKELDSDLTEKEVAAYVKSINTRRNLTMTQKAMSGAISKIDKRDTRSIAKIATSWSVSKALMENAMYIYRQDKATAIALFDGLSVDILDDKGRDTTSSKISAVYAHLKRLEQKVPKSKDEFTWNVKSVIVTQAGLDEYFKVLKEAKETGYGYSEKQCQTLALLLNYKYRLAD